MTFKAATVKIGLLALVLFFVLRLPILTKIPVFVDEAIYIRWSQIMRNDTTLRFLPLSDGKQPLFMWATMPALKFIKDPLVAGRAVSIASGFFAAAGLALFVYIVFNSLFLAASSALIYALLPFTVFFDRLALADSLLAAFGLWSLALGALLIKKPRLDVAMLLGFALGGGLLTKSPAVFFYLWQPLLLIALAKKKPTAKLFGCWLVAFVISQIIYAILRLGPNFNMIGARNQDYLFSVKEVLDHPLNPLIGNLKSSLNWLWFLFTPPLFIVAFLSFLNKDKRKVVSVLLISLSALLAQAFVAKVYTSRYILFAAVPLIPLVALGFDEAMKRLKPQVKFLLPVILVWPLMLSWLMVSDPVKANMPFDMRNGYLEEWTAGWGQKEIAAYLIDKSNQGQKIIVGTDGFFGTLPDGLQIYTQGYPNITVIGGPPNITSLPDSLTNSLKDKANTVYYVVNASRLHLPVTELARLQLIAEYPKPTRLDGTHESILFFRLLR